MTRARDFLKSHRAFVLGFVFLLGPSGPALAGDGNGNLWTLTLENDVFAAKTDKNYTGSGKIQYRAGEDDTPGFARWIAAAFLGAEPGHAVFPTYAAGVSVYTPEDTKSSVPLTDQHPYAGWLYGEFGIHVDQGDTLNSLVIAAGVVGPSSGAHKVQSWIHDVINNDDPKGWDNQLADEPGLLISLERKWRHDLGALWGLGVDLIPMAGVAVGNVQTEAQLGLILRLAEGQDRAGDWGPVRVRPGMAGPGPKTIKGAPSWQVYAGVQGRLTAQNIFLDGNSWEESVSVHKWPYVVDFELGGSARISDSMILGFTYVVRGEEFDGQDGMQNFGAIHLTAEF